MPPSEEASTAEECRPNKQTIKTSSNIEHSRKRTRTQHITNHRTLHTLLPVTMPGKEELPDWYDALSIPQTADEAAIRKAYRNLARQLHPDKNVGKVTNTHQQASKQTLQTMLMPVCCVIVQEEWAANRFVVVKKAYEGLQDPEKRAALDKQLKKKRVAAKRYAAATAKQQQMRKGRWWCQCAPLSPSHTRHSDTHSRGRQLACFLPELDRAERTAEKEKNESRRTQWAAKDQVQCWAGAATACITSSLV